MKAHVVHQVEDELLHVQGDFSLMLHMAVA
jgi:hypothetical protein